MLYCKTLASLSFKMQSPLFFVCGCKYSFVAYFYVSTLFAVYKTPVYLIARGDIREKDKI